MRRIWHSMFGHPRHLRCIASTPDGMLQYRCACGKYIGLRFHSIHIKRG